MLYSKQRGKKDFDISVCSERLFMLHMSSLSADLKLRTQRQHAATQIPACIWTHYNSEPIWAALQGRTRRREKEGGQKRNVTVKQLENSSYCDYIVCQDWKSTTKKALFVNPVIFILLFLFAYLFCSHSPKSNPLNMLSTDREIPLTSYLLCPTRMSFFVGVGNGWGTVTNFPFASEAQRVLSLLDVFGQA